MSENVTVNLATTADGQSLQLVKVEPGSVAPGETITEIQNYLETFNKEIEGNVVEGQEGREGNTYYVDESGQYYYTQPVVTVVSSDGENAVLARHTDSQGYVAVQRSSNIGEQESTQTSNSTVTLSGESGNQMLINTSEGTFGTVTIMPQDSMSYVLIVQPSDTGGKGGLSGEDQDAAMLVGEEDQEQALTVYDFNDAEDGGEVDQMESEVEDDKSKIVKIITNKKSQTITTAHMCNYCNYTSPKRYLLSRHMKSHSEERPHKCSVCERGFKTLASLQNHVNTHTGTKPHHCKFCDSSFTTSGELVRHVRYRHTHEKPHRCPECDYASVELSKLKRHIRCHTGERPYQCPHCTYASPDTFKLKRHLRIHTGEKPYECEICRSRFTQSNSLKAHRLIHSVADKPVFKCELCPTTCGRKTDLRIHVQKLHTSDRVLKCKRCGKTFPDRYTYKVHSKTHEGEKCYRCELCPYASISARHLESHMLIHTDHKPFQCDLCDQSFRQKQLLKRHQNLYHTPGYIPPPPKEKTHECPECGRAFRHKGNLIRHLAVHDPESSNHEKALALKLGRQKKIQFIDGQQVEVMTVDDEDEDEEEEEEDEDELGDSSELIDVNVDINGRQQYVVLEVIQLQDGDGDQTVAVMGADGSLSHGAVTISEQDLLAQQTITGDPVGVIASNGELMQAISHKDGTLIKLERQETEKEMKNCFGFDDEDDVDEEMEETEQPKTSIQLIN